MRRVLAMILGLSGGAAMAQDCPEFAEPVLDLAFASRYVTEDETRSEINPERAEAAEAALAPLDDFISEMSSRTDDALENEDTAAAACVLAELAHWARSDALSDLATETVELTIGSRLAALALIAGQVSSAGSQSDLNDVKNWLTRRMEGQMTFWETAPNGSAQGNLRAWAALAASATSRVTDDAMVRGWAAWSISYVMCTANDNGSLPQEMGRGSLALHYQLHAVAPLVVAAAVLEKQGLSVMDRCDRALERIVGYTMRDLGNGGAQTQAVTGEVQSLKNGVGELKDFQLAWGEAWLSLRPNREVQDALEARRPLRYSKLGGDQTRMWQSGF